MHIAIEKLLVFQQGLFKSNFFYCKEVLPDQVIVCEDYR